MKRVMAMLIFQTRHDAERAADALDEAGYELNIREDIVDVYSAATFMEAWRYVAGEELRPVTRSSTNSMSSSTPSKVPRMRPVFLLKVSTMTLATPRIGLDWMN